MIALYVLENKINKKLYVGQTIDLERRMKEHKGHRGHKTSIVDRIIRKYGWDNFKQHIFYVLEDNLDYFEIEMIKRLNTIRPNGYNISNGGSSGMKGRKHSEVTLRLMSAAHKGKVFSAEHREKIRVFLKNRAVTWGDKISKAQKGGHRSAETKAKMSAAGKGKVFSEETREKMKGPRPNMCGNKNPMFGKNHTVEARNKMSDALKGLIPWNRGLKGVQISWNKGKKLSEETKAKISKARRGSHLSDAIREIRNETMRGKKRATPFQ